jgi:hypothetical protein
MSELIIADIKFNITSENGFIIATNDKLNLKYLTKYNETLVINTAQFSSDYNYIMLKCDKNGKPFILYLLNEILYNVRVETYDLYGNYLKKNSDDLVKIAKRRLQLKRMRISRYYEDLNINSHLDLLEKIVK